MGHVLRKDHALVQVAGQCAFRHNVSAPWAFQEKSCPPVTIEIVMDWIYSAPRMQSSTTKMILHYYKYIWRKSYSYIMLMAEIPNNQLRCFWTLVNNGRFQQNRSLNWFSRRGFLVAINRISSPDSNHLKPKGKDPQALRGSLVTRSFRSDPLIHGTPWSKQLDPTKKSQLLCKTPEKIINM